MAPFNMQVLQLPAKQLLALTLDQEGFHLYICLFNLHFNLVTSIIALVFNVVELEWQLKWLNIIILITISLDLKRGRTRRYLLF